jgi:surfeit locus 1 family protein
MSFRLAAFLAFSLTGLAVLVGLGSWQVQRMAWKADLLAQMEVRLTAAPVPLPDPVVPVRDAFLSVVAEGRFTGEDRLVMASRRGVGAGWLIVTAFETADGRRIMVERGFLPDAERNRPRPASQAAITGNLHWPEEADFFSPAPDRQRGLWYARDVAVLAADLGTEPAYVILRTTTEAAPPAAITPLTTAGVPDNHLGYAFTWFSLALIWAGMTAVLLRRIRRQRAQEKAAT